MHQLRHFRSLFPVLLPVLTLAFALAAHAQDDTPSLGDVARQARQQKQKDAQTKAPTDATAPNQNAPNQIAPNKGTQAQTKDAQSQNKDTQGKDSAASTKKTQHVITNDEIPSHVGPTSTNPGASRRANGGNSQGQPPYDEAAQRSAAAPSWTSQIQSSKMHIESLKDQIAQISSSIQYAGGNCVSGCVQWNEQQKRKQDQVDAMKAQLDQEQQHLDEMQDQCGRQGFGSSVCDP